MVGHSRSMLCSDFNKKNLIIFPGLAIAGVGGVASSKPVATAVVGPGGLAVARPIATAIAGISPSEVAELGIPLKYKTPFIQETASSSIYLPTRKYGLAQGTGRDRIGVLVGPDFQNDVKPEIDSQPIAAEEPYSPQTETKYESYDEIEAQRPEPADNTRSAVQQQENELLLPPIPLNSQPQVAPQNIPQQTAVQYPFIPPVSPFRFNWNSEPVDQAARYEPLPYYDQRAYQVPQFYPFQQNTLPIHPYHFQSHF